MRITTSADSHNCTTRPRVLRASLLLVLAALAAGCRPKASYLRAEQGGYNLVTTACSIEGAVRRIGRTADELCPGQAYQLTEPRILDRDWNVGILGMSGSKVTMQAYLSCSPQPPPVTEPPTTEPPLTEPPGAD